jgi:hypothetical protein
VNLLPSLSDYNTIKAPDKERGLLVWEDYNMGSYLEVCGWSGCEKIPVTVIGETASEFWIEAVETTFLPGRGTFKKGQPVYVPKAAVTLEAGQNTSRACKLLSRVFPKPATGF